MHGRRGRTPGWLTQVVRLPTYRDPPPITLHTKAARRSKGVKLRATLAYFELVPLSFWLLLPDCSLIEPVANSLSA
jgi:hypothetical protein